jgi:hypothetical protein
MTVQVADVHAHVQRLISVVKRVIVLEDCTTKEQRSVVHFLWAKGLNAKDIHKEMFLVYGGKCLSYKGVRKWSAKETTLVANVLLMTKSLKRRCGSV